MSWMVVLMKVPPEIKALDETLPPGFDLPPLGTKAEVLALLAELFPDANFADPTWVTLEREEYVIEFVVGDEDPVFTVGFRPHGADSLMSVLQQLCERTGWRAFDTSSSEFIDFSQNPLQGLQESRAYAQKVIGPSFNPKGVRLTVPSGKQGPA